jgi:hypothetical protein
MALFLNLYTLDIGSSLNPIPVDLNQKYREVCISTHIWCIFFCWFFSLGQKPPQRVSFKQGLAVPLFCSVSLFGFYSLLRLFPNFDLRTFISAYLGLAGAVAVTSNLTPPLRLLLPTPDNLRWKIGMALFTTPLDTIFFLNHVILSTI